MSALAWLFGLGALAVAFPLLFHLIRRTPKGQTEFSSLMFLKPTPPTLTRRSRLENILLLLMRAAAICLIAIAFMRPFFPSSDTLADVKLANRRIAILLDTSASMQRAGLWDQATQKVEEVLAGLEDGDDIALLAFDDGVAPIVDFANGNDEASVDRVSLIRDALKDLAPGWRRSDLGRALVSVADNLDVWRDSQKAKDVTIPSKLQIVVVSDLQKGSHLESLQSYQWPDHVFVKFQPVVPVDYTNATVQLLAPVPEEDDPAFRVRVANSDESKVEQFFVNFSGDDRLPLTDPISFYVPQGTSRVLKVPPDQAVFAKQFDVTGDTEDFDNTFYVVPVKQQVFDVAYIGSDDPDDPEHPQYYFRRAMIETPSRLVSVRQLGNDEKLIGPGIKPPTMAVLTAAVDENRRVDIEAFLKSGGSLLVLLTEESMVDNTIDWTAARLKSNDAKRKSKDNYLMLADIDFSNPVFQPFANPRYNDFTKIRFWSHQSVELVDPDVKVVARFDNDDPAVWIRDGDDGGKVYSFASGWQPNQSQLGLSTKFVPLVNGLVEIAAEIPELDKSVLVGDKIEFPAGGESEKRSMLKPDGSREVIGSDQTQFIGVDLPGIYRLESSRPSLQTTSPETSISVKDDPGTAQNDVGADDSAENELSSLDGATLFAVNVDRAESETAAIPVAQIEMFEVKVGEQETAASELAQMRVLRDRDIESRQKVWKWLIVAAMVLLIGESWLASMTEKASAESNTSSESNAVTNESSVPSGLSGEMT